MIRRIVWACTLAVTVLLVLPASASTTSTDRSDAAPALRPDSRLGTGLQPVPSPSPVPTCGTGPGDDDTPNRTGAPSRDTITAADGRKFWSLNDLSAWLQRHVVFILRAKR